MQNVRYNKKTMHFILVYNVYYHKQLKDSAVHLIYNGEH